MPKKTTTTSTSSSTQQSTSSNTHTIVKGDTIWQIAIRYYGSPLFWRKIKEANPKTALQVNDLKAKEILILPDLTERLSCISGIAATNPDGFYVFSIGDCGANDDTQQAYIRPPGVYKSNALINDLYTGDDTVDAASFARSSDNFSVSWQAVVASAEKVRGNKATTTATSTATVYQALLSIVETALYSGNASEMSALRTDFVNFRVALEELEQNHQVIASGAANSLAAILLSNLPMGIGETAYFNFGVNNGDGNQSPYIDVKPGMRLRMDATVMQTDSSDTNLSGAVSSGQFAYDVYRQANGKMTFNPLTSSIASPTIDETGLSSGMVDVHAKGDARKHYRILYPTRLADANKSGSSDAAQNVVLLGADTLKELNTATVEYQNDGIIRTQVNPVSVTIFRGRVWMWVEIPVYVNGQQVYVPAGTTVQQLMSRYVPHARHLAQEEVFSMSRLYHNESGVPTSVPVTFEVDSALDLAVYDLPLLAHDNINLQWMNI